MSCISMRARCCWLARRLWIPVVVLVCLSHPAFALEMTRPAFHAATPVVKPAGFPHMNATLGFNINLVYQNTPSVSEAAAFSAAKATWESIIVGYQIDDIYSTTLTIDVNLSGIDGSGGVLGSSGPTEAKLNFAQDDVTASFVYADKGEMTFDTADTADLAADGLLDEVILHEMGHILGIGTLWSSSAAGFAGRQELYVEGSGKYTGPAGLAAYNAEFGRSGTYVPVELGGGAGTANGHWDEVNGGIANTGIVSSLEPAPYNDMRYELMTGWLNPPQAFLSSLTKQSLVDLGYVVIPEPSSGALLVLGLAMLAMRRCPRADKRV